MSHLVPYRRTDLRCGWVSQVSGHQGKQFEEGVGERTCRKEKLGKVGLPSRGCAGVREERLPKPALLFRCC